MGPELTGREVPRQGQPSLILTGTLCMEAGWNTPNSPLTRAIGQAEPMGSYSRMRAIGHKVVNGQMALRCTPLLGCTRGAAFYARKVSRGKWWSECGGAGAKRSAKRCKNMGEKGLSQAGNTYPSPADDNMHRPPAPFTCSQWRNGDWQTSSQLGSGNRHPMHTRLAKPDAPKRPNKFAPPPHHFGGRRSQWDAVAKRIFNWFLEGQ